MRDADLLIDLLLMLATFTPMIGILLILLHRFSYKAKAYLSVGISAITLLLILVVAPEIVFKQSTSIQAPFMERYGIDLVLYADGLSILFTLVISFFGLIAILYSVRDMEEEEGATRYYASMLLFLGSMMWLVLSGNFLFIFIFWEIVGICSYALIGFHTRKVESNRASFKALLMTRSCGIFLLLGALILYSLTGTFDLPLVSERIQAMDGSGWITLVMILFFIASMAKSVQFPLHTWLPEATVAPSAVTAYLHAAAMVKAGVYLVSRCYFLFGGIQEKVIISIMIATVGSFTLVIGTMAAWAQEDVKKLLAFSTIGQIGYIFLGLGLGTNLGTTAALFHYLNHAIFKGLLFLCAGCLIYATGTKNLNEMGGLARNMPITAGAMIIGGLSLAGVPPLNGFASKLLIYEAILETSWTAQGIVGKLYIFYFVLALLGSVASLAALMKVIHVAFLGRRPERLKDVKEVPWGMRIPLLVLSALCLIFGIAPQIPLALLINPVAGQVVPVVAFGYETFIGSYQATLLTGLILLSLLIGAIIYFAVTRRKSSISSDEKYGIFTGGEVESPYLELEKMKVGSEPFIFAPQKVLSSAYNFMRQGGIDIIYLGIARSVQRFSIWFSALTSTNIGIAALFLVLIGVAIFTPPHAGAMLMMLGALMALAQSDLRRMLAWASVSQIGHIILELASGIDEGRVGGILHLLNFAIFGALLYLSILAVIRRTNTKMVGEIAGLSYGMPVTALAFLIGGLSMAGLPPLSGWWSEFYILDTTIKMARPELTFAVAIVSALTLAYVVRAFHRVFLGETPDRYRSITEAPLRSLIPIALLILLTLIIGIYPFPWISLIEHVLESLR